MDGYARGAVHHARFNRADSYLRFVLQVAEKRGENVVVAETRVRMPLTAAARAADVTGIGTGLVGTQRSSAPVLLPYHAETSSNEKYVGLSGKN